MLAPSSSQPRLLMCPPRHFAVTYSINPWMDPQTWATLHAEAQHQWEGLRRALLGAGAAIETIDPAHGLPDLVFTANAAVVLDRKIVLSRFRRSRLPVFGPWLRSVVFSRGETQPLSGTRVYQIAQIKEFVLYQLVSSSGPNLGLVVQSRHVSRSHGAVSFSLATGAYLRWESKLADDIASAEL